MFPNIKIYRKKMFENTIFHVKKMFENINRLTILSEFECPSALSCELGHERQEKRNIIL